MDISERLKIFEHGYGDKKPGIGVYCVDACCGEWFRRDGYTHDGSLTIRWHPFVAYAGLTTFFTSAGTAALDRLEVFWAREAWHFGWNGKQLPKDFASEFKDDAKAFHELGMRMRAEHKPLPGNAFQWSAGVW